MTAAMYKRSESILEAEETGYVQKQALESTGHLDPWLCLLLLGPS